MNEKVCECCLREGELIKVKCEDFEMNVCKKCIGTIRKLELTEGELKYMHNSFKLGYRKQFLL